MTGGSTESAPRIDAAQRVGKGRRVSSLNQRARSVLYAAVREFIETGEPVGSRTLAQKYGFELSPATIRGVLADLETAGYLTQPHTSAGRVPTESAFRLFIDALMRVRELTGEEQARIQELFVEARPGTELLRQAGRLLADLSGTAAVVLRSGVESRRVQKLHFIPLRERELLAVVVFSDGGVENRFLELTEVPSAAELERVHALLEEIARGSTLTDLARALHERLLAQQAELRRVHELGEALVGAALASATPRDELVVEGKGRLFERPEFADAGRLRELIDALDRGEQLVALLGEVLADGHVQVRFGDEAGPFGRVSLVAAPYQEGAHTSGAVGVLGPTRMDYSTLVPLVGATAEALTEALSRSRDGRS